MIAQQQLTRYLDEYLACGSYKDYAPNGLQVEGRASIQRIASAVSASQEVINKAIALKVDALFVHHGYFWRGEPLTITGIKRQRIASLLAHEINLFAYHLPLDCHPVVGNNACLGRLLLIDTISTHEAGSTANLLWRGVLKAPRSVSQFSDDLTKILMQSPGVIEGGDHAISTVVWCSGGAQDFIDKAHQLGAQAYISGEISERTYYQAKELGLHYFSCGHHATERFGIQALCEHLAERFSLSHQFIDTANPV